MTNEEFIQSITLPGEEWRDVVGYDYLYAVSSFGRFASLNKMYSANGVLRNCKPVLKELAPQNCNGKKYYRTHVTKDGKSICISIHTLVAKAFIPNPNNHFEVDHIDRNGLNNHVSNLRWVTHQGNQNNPETLKAFSRVFKERSVVKNRRPILQIKDGELIRRYNRIWDVVDYGFSPSAVVNTLKGRSKSSGGCQWMYLSDYESQVGMSKNSI